MMEGSSLAWSILGPDGAVAEYLDEYEYRPGQIAMASLVARSLWKAVSIVEAGTGTGPWPI